MEGGRHPRQLRPARPSGPSLRNPSQWEHTAFAKVLDDVYRSQRALASPFRPASLPGGLELLGWRARASGTCIRRLLNKYSGPLGGGQDLRSNRLQRVQHPGHEFGYGRVDEH